MTATWICLWVLVAAIMVPHWVPGLRAGEDKPILFVLALLVAVVLLMLQAFLTARDDRRQPRPR